MDKKIINLFNLISNYLYKNNYLVDADELDFNYFYRIGKKNTTLALFANAFDGYESFMDEETSEGFKQALAFSLRKKYLFKKEREIIANRLNESKVKYCYLKGIVMEKLYPDIADREMADNDIYYDVNKQEEVLEIFKDLKYDVVSLNRGVHDSYHKAPVYNFEMHRYLMSLSYGDDLYNYFKDIDSKMTLKEGYEYVLNDNDFYIYKIVHDYKHYSNYGTGIKSIIDASLCNEKLKLDYNYIESELKKIKLDDFEKNIRNLAYKLMHNDFELNEEENKVFKRIYSSSTYGNMDNMVQNKLEKEKRSEYIKRRLFLPEGVLKEVYPFFYKHKNLRFLLMIYRCIRTVFTARKRVGKEIKLVFKYSKNKKNN